MPDEITPRPPISTSVRIGWAVFWITLFLPAVFILSLLNPSQQPNEVTVALLLFVLSPLCILYGGIWLALRFFKSPWARLGLGLLFIILLLIVNFAIFFVGCLAALSNGFGH